MSQTRKNLIVGQSGGPTAAINSSLYGVVKEGLRQKEKIAHVYGMVNGIEGFLNGTVLDFEDISFRKIWKMRYIRNYFKNLKS